ncbi:hypothetical protein [Dokdonella sp.]|uniref:hypothetical protein n=1 Tax=Dokdonella sp. TaxID=2291710 RepID=UPI003529CF02
MNRLIHTRLGLALAIAFGICIAELSNIVAQDDAFAGAETAALVGITPPAASVSDSCAPPMLPLIVVKPSYEDLLDAESAELLSAISSSAPALSIPDLLPRVRLDMPYYSFGKLMPGATKE